MPAQREHEVDLRISLVRATFELPDVLERAYYIEVPFRALTIVAHVELRENESRKFQRHNETECIVRYLCYS